MIYYNIYNLCFILFRMESIKPLVNISKNAQTARSGFKAEEIFRKDDSIRKNLEIYFKKNILQIDKIHGKKYDTIIQFEDNTRACVQNKKFEHFGGRGDSFDRRAIHKTFDNVIMQENLKLLTCSRPTKTTTSMIESDKISFMKLCEENIGDIRSFITKTLIGEESEKNEYWCFMKTDNLFTDIQLYMVSSEKLLQFIFDSLKIHISTRPNGTCLHLSPYIALQRKGGNTTDHSPDDIQCKLKMTTEMIDICERIL